jgi:hypothetical protein
VKFLQLISDFDFFNQQLVISLLKKGGGQQVVKNHFRREKTKYIERQNSIHRFYLSFYEGGLLCVSN